MIQFNTLTFGRACAKTPDLISNSLLQRFDRNINIVGEILGGHRASNGCGSALGLEDSDHQVEIFVLRHVDTLTDWIFIRKHAISDSRRDDTMRVHRKVFGIGDKMSRPNFEPSHICVFGSAANQSTIEFPILELKLTSHFPNWQSAANGWNRRNEQIEVLTSQSIGRQACGRHLFARWLNRSNHDGIGAETLDLLLSLISDPFTDSQQPNDAGYADKDTEHCKQ